MFIKLGKNAHFFYDPVEKFQLVPGEVLEIKGRPTNGVFKKAMAGGHIEITEDPHPKVIVKDPRTEKEVPIGEETSDPLMTMSVKNILEEYKFLVDEDKTTAERLSKKSKADLITFLRQVEKTYSE